MFILFCINDLSILHRSPVIILSINVLILDPDKIDWIPEFGYRFDAFVKCHDFMTYWATRTGQLVSIDDSKTIASANLKMYIRLELEYVYVKYKCHFHGAYVLKGKWIKKTHVSPIEQTFLHVIVLKY